MDLAALKLRPGEGRRIEVDVDVDDVSFGGQTYSMDPRTVDVILDISRMSGEGYALRLRTSTTLRGPCMRCLDDASLRLDVDAREVDQPGEVEELRSPYLDQPVVCDGDSHSG